MPPKGIPENSVVINGKKYSLNTDLKDIERQPCEIWTRVMGYFRPLSEFNKGKKSEFFSRKYFKESKIINK